MLQEISKFSKLNLLKVVEALYASKFIMTMHLIEVKQALFTKVVREAWLVLEVRQLEKEVMVQNLLLAP